MAEVEHETTLGTEGDGTFIPVPVDVPALFGRVRARVVVTVNGHTALDAFPAARAAFDALSYSHRREWVDAVTEARRPETRARRIARVVEAMRGA